MFDNCKNCLFYAEYYDEMYQQEYDEEDESVDEDIPQPIPHFCIDYTSSGIPDDIWNGKTKCNHYIAK